jgi:hypothetical protein
MVASLSVERPIPFTTNFIGTIPQGALTYRAWYDGSLLPRNVHVDRIVAVRKEEGLEVQADGLEKQRRRIAFDRQASPFPTGSRIPIAWREPRKFPPLTGEGEITIFGVSKPLLLMTRVIVSDMGRRT